ncbi:phospholipase D-like domain-containing protein [Hansschlegelia plantiphila]|uniref:Phospholipase D n=1 Tax=Hansschlegelia plantiphila TaxID=374655 RepID=A0A9W6J119_9HYPH|nr:phospholipase D-like domain-containing protein [Hansschlegelia plantiphila]GLK68392.1 cardiolipin synthase [Hansschlegelia plantiphila]
MIVASVATIHALLNKRDVRAAIGWIGVTWLSPVFGALLYFAFGINRVHRKARRLRGLKQAGGARRGARPTKSRDQLQAAVGAITGLQLEDGAVDMVLQSGDEAYPRMIAAIGEAKKSVALSTFIFRTDAPGLQFIEALSAAHRRGVAVRVLIDGMGGGFFLSRAYRRLRSEGVPAARFLHSIWPWKMPLLDLRLHKKALIIDGEFAFVGGLNIAAENVLARPTGSPVRDTHFRVIGNVVGQIADGFDDDWAFATGEDPDDAPPPRIAPAAALARAIPSGPDQAVDQLALVLMSAIASAKRSIRIATPYFLPEEQLITALQLAAWRGVEVRLVMPAKNNHRMVAWAAEAHIRPLLEAGCSLWRSPPPFDHSKLMTVDDEFSLIGSANWDARSLRLNFELTVELYDRDLSARLSGLIDGKCVDRVTLADVDGRLFVTKMRDATVRLLSPYL